MRFQVNGEEKEESSTTGSSDEADVESPPTPRTRRRRRKRRAKKLTVVPGLDTYSQAVSGEKSHIVFSTSLTRDIDENEFNRSCEEGNKTEFIRFRGKKINYIKKNITTHLNRVHPYSVTLLGGGNDLPVSQVAVSPVFRIVKDIIEAGHVCKDNGVNTVAISSIPPRKFFHFQLYRKVANDLLRVECAKHGFVFIDSKGIVMREHLLRDGVHLNPSGTEVLRKIFLEFINNMG